MSDAIGKHIWPKKKFIQSEEELCFGGRLQKKMCKHMHCIAKYDQTRFWEDHKTLFYKKFTRKKNNVSSAIKRKLEGKLFVDAS